MKRRGNVALAVALVLLIGLTGAFMWVVTTFLFYFRNIGAGLPHQVELVVNYGALAVIGVTILLAAIIWNIRSPRAALITTVIATPVGWAVAIFVEWRLSLELVWHSYD
jgi:hypothetical protein